MGKKMFETFSPVCELSVKPLILLGIFGEKGPFLTLPPAISVDPRVKKLIETFSPVCELSIKPLILLFRL